MSQEIKRARWPETIATAGVRRSRSHYVATAGAVGVLLVAGLTGCSGAETGTAEPAPTESTATAPPPPAGPMAPMPAGIDLQLAQPGQLTVCTTGGPAPFISRASRTDQKVEGFDIDILNLVGQRIGATPIFKELTSPQLNRPDTLSIAHCDLRAGEMTADTDPQPYYTATRPYFLRTLTVLAKAGTQYQTLDSLAGKRVLVQSDSDGARLVNDYNAAHGNAISVRPLADRNSVGPEVLRDTVDAAIVDNGLALSVLKERSDKTLTAGGALSPPEKIVFGVRNGDTALTEQINAAIADAGGNGHYAQAYANWFAGPPQPLPPN